MSPDEMSTGLPSPQSLDLLLFNSGIQRHTFTLASSHWFSFSSDDDENLGELVRDQNDEDGEIEAVLGLELDGECDPHDQDDLEEDKVEPPVAATFHESIQADIEELIGEARKQTQTITLDSEDFEDIVDIEDSKKANEGQAGASAGAKRDEQSDSKQVIFFYLKKSIYLNLSIRQKPIKSKKI